MFRNSQYPWQNSFLLLEVQITLSAAPKRPFFLPPKESHAYFTEIQQSVGNG